MENDIKREFIENIIFEELKDELKINTMAGLRYYLSEKKLDNIVDAGNIYRKMVNFRINKYGTSSFNVSVSNEEKHNYILNKYL